MKVDKQIIESLTAAKESVLKDITRISKGLFWVMFEADSPIHWVIIIFSGVLSAAALVNGAFLASIIFGLFSYLYYKVPKIIKYFKK